MASGHLLSFFLQFQGKETRATIPQNFIILGTLLQILQRTPLNFLLSLVPTHTQFETSRRLPTPVALYCLTIPVLTSTASVQFWFKNHNYNPCLVFALSLPAKSHPGGAQVPVFFAYAPTSSMTQADVTVFTTAYCKWVIYHDCRTRLTLSLPPTLSWCSLILYLLDILKEKKSVFSLPNLQFCLEMYTSAYISPKGKGKSIFPPSMAHVCYPLSA